MNRFQEISNIQHEEETFLHKAKEAQKEEECRKQ